MLISFAIFDINEDFLHHDIDKSMGLFFDKILSNKHNAPSMDNIQQIVDAVQKGR